MSSKFVKNESKSRRKWMVDGRRSYVAQKKAFERSWDAFRGSEREKGTKR